MENDAGSRAAGLVGGKHYTQHVDKVKALKRSGDTSAAIRLLLRLLDAVEAESNARGEQGVVAPWYYEQLAILYGKAKNYEAEVSVLRRYVAQFEGKSEGPFPTVVERLTKAETRLQRQL